MVPRGGRGSQLVCVGLNEQGQLLPAELVLRLSYAWGHLTWGAEKAEIQATWIQPQASKVKSSSHPCLKDTHHVWWGEDEWRGWAGQGILVGQSLVLNLQVSQKYVCTIHSLQKTMMVTVYAFWLNSSNIVRHCLTILVWGKKSPPEPKCKTPFLSRLKHFF